MLVKWYTLLDSRNITAVAGLNVLAATFKKVALWRPGDRGLYTPDLHFSLEHCGFRDDETT